MKRLILKYFLLGGIILTNFSMAEAVGPANVYEVRVAKFELFNGTSWVTIFEGTSKAIDIAATNSGQVAGQFFTSLAVPDGTYTRSRVTPSQVFQIKGNDGSRYTTASSGPNGGCVYTTTASAEAACSITITDAITPETTTFSSPIVINNGVPSHKVRVSFDTSGAIQYNSLADEIFPAAPTVTVTVIAL